ncbi:Uncharacterized protein Adt_14842 [Abeliophyllum distichum]|uniref:Integrase catalytic domain-containing protein n=1 Tax=Abeliophyllum distichum TaxID=126358 RepID=A0ABD1U0T3_9LAMI
MKKDSQNCAKKYDRCQKFSTIPKLPAQNLTPITSSWPFAKCRIDFIGPLPMGKGGVKFAVVAVDYFTKWCEAEPLAKITEENIWKFVWKNIVCHFGISHSLVSDNGTQFVGKKFNSNCENLGETPFAMAYGAEAMIPVEVGISSSRCLPRLTGRETHRLATSSRGLPTKNDLILQLQG